jgi:hypothetical protein
MAPMEDWVVNEAPLDHEMSTTSRGSILPVERGSMIGKHDAEGVPGQPTGMASRNAFELPDSMYETEGAEPFEHSIYPPEGL